MLFLFCLGLKHSFGLVYTSRHARSFGAFWPLDFVTSPSHYFSVVVLKLVENRVYFIAGNAGSLWETEEQGVGGGVREGRFIAEETYGNGPFCTLGRAFP